MNKTTFVVNVIETISYSSTALYGFNFYLIMTFKLLFDAFEGIPGYLNN